MKLKGRVMGVVLLLVEGFLNSLAGQVFFGGGRMSHDFLLS